MYTIKLAGRFIAFMLIISMIGCVYPAVNVVRSRQIVSVIEKNKQSQLSVVTLEHIATIEITEKSENVSSVTRITDNVNEGEISSPAISPDGKEIAFQYWQLGEQSCNIWAVPTGGGTATRRITDSDNYNLSPTWSPDGMEIIFCSNRLVQQLNLWKVKSKGIGGITRLTSGNISDHSPHVSPDGEKIVFSTLLLSRPSFGKATYTRQIWTVNSDGSELTQIRDGQMPRWVGNDKIIFVSNVGEYNHLWLMNSDGSGVTQLTLDNSNDEYPDVSPDGKKIGFCSDKSGNWDIWTMNIDGSNLMQMTTNESGDIFPVWSPDGKYIYFCSTRGRRWDIWRIEPRY